MAPPLFIYFAVSKVTTGRQYNDPDYQMFSIGLLTWRSPIQQTPNITQILIHNTLTAIIAYLTIYACSTYACMLVGQWCSATETCMITYVAIIITIEFIVIGLHWSNSL